MDEPTTKAGDELLTDIIQDHEGPSYHVIERIRSGILAIEAEVQASLAPNLWTAQELLDIYDRTADRPAIRSKIARLVNDG